jgi:hypothetical protein
MFVYNKKVLTLPCKCVGFNRKMVKFYENRRIAYSGFIEKGICILQLLILGGRSFFCFAGAACGHPVGERAGCCGVSFLSQ